MTLKSVVLPAPFGPMMPRRSPWRTWRLTSRTAVRPPKRFVTRSSVSTSSPGPEAPGEADQSLGGEAHHEDEGRAVDDEVDPGEPRHLRHGPHPDRKSTRLNSSHSQISYAVFCLKKKKDQTHMREIIHHTDH